MPSEINNRINLIMNQLGLNPNSFAKKAGVSQAVIYNIVDPKGRGSKPSYDLLEKIVTTFDVNPVWLLLEKGAIFISDDLSERGNLMGNPSGNPNASGQKKGHVLEEPKLEEYGSADNLSEAPDVLESESPTNMRSSHKLKLLQELVEAMRNQMRVLEQYNVELERDNAELEQKLKNEAFRRNLKAG